jgi:hypothetical protein
MHPLHYLDLFPCHARLVGHLRRARKGMGVSKTSPRPSRSARRLSADSGGISSRRARTAVIGRSWYEVRRLVVGEDARAWHHTGADALPATDSEVGGGAPARTDRIMCDKWMLAGRAKIRGSDVDVDECGRRRVHVESVRPGSIGPDGDRQRPPIRCQRKYPLVALPYPRAIPPNRMPDLPWQVRISEGAVPEFETPPAYG